MVQNKSPNKSILLIANSYPEFLDLCGVISNKFFIGRMVYVWFTEIYPDDWVRQRLESLNISFELYGPDCLPIKEDGENEKQDANVGIRPYLVIGSLLFGFSSLVKRTLKINTKSNLRLISDAVLALHTYRIVRKRFTQIKKFLKKTNPGIVLAAEASPPYKFGMVKKILSAKRIKMFVFPYTVANWKEYFEAYKGRESHQVNSFMAKWVKKIRPMEVYNSEGLEILRLPVYYYPAYFRFKLLPNLNPWAMNSYLESALLVDSQFQKDYFSQQGLPEDRIYVVGSSHLDNLWVDSNQKEARRKEIARKYQVDLKKDIVLCCPPPYQSGRGVQDFETYDAFLSKYIQEVKEQFYDSSVLFKFHPRMGEEEIASFEEKLNIFSMKEETSWLLPLASLYVTSISATIRWALALEIPVLNHDVYNYCYNDFEASPNVHTTFSFEAFSANCKLFSEKLKSEKRLWDSGESSEYWGGVDGKSSDRLNSWLREELGEETK